MIRSAQVSLNDIPRNWKKRRISEIASQIKAGGSFGYTKNQDYQSHGFPAFSAAGQDGFVDKYEYEGPGIVVSAIGARCGKCFLAEGKWTTMSNTQAIIVDESKMSTKFLWYLINDEDFWHKSGTAQPFIKPSDVHNSWIPVPPLEEQYNILAILDTLENMVLHHQKQIEKITDLYRGMLERLRRGELVESNQIRKKIKNIAKLQMGETIISQQLQETGIPVFSADTGTKPWGYIGSTKKVFSKGTIVLSARGSIGFPRLPEFEHFISTQTTIAITPNEAFVRPKYVHLWLQTINYAHIQCTQAIPMITVGDIQEIVVSLPAKDKQDKIIEVFHHLSAIKDLHLILKKKHAQLLKEVQSKILYGKSLV